MQKEIKFLRKELQSVLNCTEFAHICSLFLSGNVSSIKTHEDIQINKLNERLRDRQPRQDSEKVIFNYSNISLSDAEKSLLVAGLKFSILPKELSYADYLVNFKLFCGIIYNSDSMSNENLDFVKTKIKDATLT